MFGGCYWFLIQPSIFFIIKCYILYFSCTILSSILEVAISVPLNHTFDYICSSQVVEGVRVRVPFGRKKTVGIVLKIKDKSDFSKLKEVDAVLDGKPIFTKEMLVFFIMGSKILSSPTRRGVVISLAKKFKNWQKRGN